MGDKKEGWLKSFKEIFRSILKAEKGTTGRVNLTFVVVVLIVGVARGELFTVYGAVVVALIICSGIVNQLIPFYSGRRR
jgi:hypothetical protein